MKRVEKTIGDTNHAAMVTYDGELQQEMYSSGDLALFRVRTESGFEETYLLAGQVISADKYEAVRQSRLGMPRANPDQDGVGLVLAALGDVGDLDNTDYVNDFTVRAIFEASENVGVFLHKGGCLFGESHEETVALCKSLIDIGAELAIDSPEAASDRLGPYLAGGLVIKLPETTEGRLQVFSVLSPYAEKSGYPIQRDAGQSYLYVLDS